MLDAATRLRHSAGRSTSDLLRQRAGTGLNFPDAVITPRTHDEVLAVLGAATRHRVAVVPFGGGTSVTGGVEPLRGGLTAVVALDLRRMNRLVAVDTISLTATLEAGLRGPQAERLLGAARPHARAPAAELRARDDRRLRRDPFRRAGLRRLRTVR